jgi:hypothetical protein
MDLRWIERIIVKHNGLVSVLLVSLSCSPVLLADDFDEARSKAEAFIGHYEDIRSLKAKEVSKLINELCGYEDEDGKSVFNEVKSRVTEEVNKYYDDFIHFRAATPASHTESSVV